MVAAPLSGVSGGQGGGAASCDARSRRSWRSCARLRAVVEAKLELRWSPQQISGWLVDEFPDDPEMRVSHETIYLSLFVQSRGALRKELTRYLRSGHTTRRPRGHTVMNGQGQLRGTLNIRERPAEAERPCRARPLGRRPAHGQTACTRWRRWWNARPASSCWSRCPNGHAADVVADALAAKIIELPDQLRRSLTWDQGKEMAAHARFTIDDRRARSTSATRAAPGSAAATRTPTGCCASTSPSAPRSRTTPKPTSTPSPPNSTDALDKPSAGGHHHKHSTKRCDDHLSPRPLGARVGVPCARLCACVEKPDRAFGAAPWGPPIASWLTTDLYLYAIVSTYAVARPKVIGRRAGAPMNVRKELP